MLMLVVPQNVNAGGPVIYSAITSDPGETKTHEKTINGHERLK